MNANGETTDGGEQLRRLDAPFASALAAVGPHVVVDYRNGSSVPLGGRPTSIALLPPFELHPVTRLVKRACQVSSRIRWRSLREER